MRLTDPQVSRFQKLYKARFGCDLSKDEALAEGLKLLLVINITYRPVSKADMRETELKLALSSPSRVPNESSELGYAHQVQL